MQITLLEDHQIWGNKALSVMKQYGVTAGASDMAVILGTAMFSGSVDAEGNASTAWWSASSDDINDDINNTVLYADGKDKEYIEPNYRTLAVRPALPPSATSQIPENQVLFTRKINGAQIVEYGAYPQSALGPQDALEIENMQVGGKLSITGKKYTFDTVNIRSVNTKPHFTHYDEYTDGNALYVCVQGQRCDSASITRNGISVKSGEKYWLRVEPIEWLADPSGWWVTKDCLLSGIHFNPGKNYDGNFEKTEMFAYLNNYFAKEMLLAPEQKAAVAAAKAYAAKGGLTKEMLLAPEQKVAVASAKASAAKGGLTVESVREFIKQELGADFLKDFDTRWIAAHPKSAIVNAKSRQR